MCVCVCIQCILYTYRWTAKTQIHWIFIVGNLFAFPLVSHTPFVTLFLLLKVLFSVTLAKTIAKTNPSSSSNNNNMVSLLIYLLPLTILLDRFIFLRKNGRIHVISPMSYMIQAYVSWCHWGKCIEERKKKRKDFFNRVSNALIFFFFLPLFKCPYCVRSLNFEIVSSCL